MSSIGQTSLEVMVTPLADRVVVEVAGEVDRASTDGFQSAMADPTTQCGPPRRQRPISRSASCAKSLFDRALVNRGGVATPPRTFIPIQTPLGDTTWQWRKSSETAQPILAPPSAQRDESARQTIAKQSCLATTQTNSAERANVLPP